MSEIQVTTLVAQGSSDEAAKLVTADSYLSPSPKDLPSTTVLRQWLPLYMHKTDLVISHLDRMLSTPSGIDTILMACGYSSLTASSLLSKLSLHQLQTSARNLMSIALCLPASTAILITPGEIRPPRLLRLSQSLKALSQLISDFRIFVRLWGLLGLWKWGRTLLADPPKDIVFKCIAWAQIVVTAAFQILENGAYLSSKGVLGFDSKTQRKAWKWSSRFWATHVALDILRLARERNIYRSKGETNERAMDSEAVQVWKRQAVTTLAYAPLTLHWSVEQGLVSELWVGILGTIAATGPLTQLWTRTVS